MNSGITPPSFLLRGRELVPATEPVIRLQDAAITCGHGLFETIKIYSGRPFALREHLDRLAAGSHALALEPPSQRDAGDALATLLQANGQNDAPECRFRITLTGGHDSSLVFYELTDCPPHPATAVAITGPYVRNERSMLTGFKTLSYGENAPAIQQTRAVGADEALWRNTREELCEGTWSNVFVFLDGTWMTPPLTSGCLPGVTRGNVITLARDAGIPLLERPVPFTELSRIEAAFLTSSLREIQPVSRLDGRILDSESAPGCAELRQAYHALARTHL